MFILHRGNLRMFLVIFGILFISYSAELFNLGISIFYTGLLLHFISKGFLYRNIELAVNGPYSFVRHPFYLANLLLDIGIILMAGHPFFIFLYLLLFCKSYHKVILQEERELAKIYSDVYEIYSNRVPRYLPKIFPFAKDWYKGFRFKNILREREISRFLRLATYPISFLIIHELLKYKCHQNKPIQVLSGIGFTIALLWISYLLHNMIERDRMSRIKILNIYLLIILLFLGIGITIFRFSNLQLNNLFFTLLVIFSVFLGIVFFIFYYLGIKKRCSDS